jgi:endonuclease/exonuclease/phosphatase (EEP) superfamily protein YafD
LVSNVDMRNKAYSQLMDMVERYDPDMLQTLESDSTWQQQLAPLEKEYPHTVKIPKSNTYGMHLYSKLPLAHTKVMYWLDKDIPSLKTFVQLPSGPWIEFHGVHPKPPVPTETDDSRMRDAEIVIVANRVEESDYPVIVAGDFNDVAWSSTTLLFRDVSGLLDPRVGRGFYNTFNANYPIVRWPLDHVFISSHFKLAEMQRLPHIGSDHFPVYIELSFEPGEQYENDPPRPDEDTQEEATETIEEGIKDAKTPEEEDNEE